MILMAPTLPSEALGNMEQEPQLAGLVTEAQKAGLQQPRGPPLVHPQMASAGGRPSGRLQ